MREHSWVHEKKIGDRVTLRDGRVCEWDGDQWKAAGRAVYFAQAEVERAASTAGDEFAPRCPACSGALVWRADWVCVEEGCGKVYQQSPYAGLSDVPKGTSREAAEGAPIFRSLNETNCDVGAGTPVRDWLDEVEYQTGWHRHAVAAKLRARGDRGEGRGLGSWHFVRIVGQAQRFDRVRQCGTASNMEWHDEETGKTMPHAHRCGHWRVCRRCLKRRQKALGEGVQAQRALALAVYRDRLNKHYAGQEGRWSERLVTLTIPHSGDLGRDVKALPEAWRLVEAPWRRHLRARGLRESQVYVRAIEVASGGHAHLHVWVLGPYVEHAVLRSWWGAALEKLGYEVPRKAHAEVVADARDTRTGRWLRGYKHAGVPWPVVDVRGGRGGAAQYAVKVCGAISRYATEGEDYSELAPVHASRVYEALEGVRVTQWARGWAPRRDRSARWRLRRIRVLATRLASHGHESPAPVENSPVAHGAGMCCISDAGRPRAGPGG